MNFYESDKQYKDSLLYKVSWLYYMDGLTQKEIADKLSISRVKIIKMLEEARNKKIVRFQFSTVYREKNTVEKELIQKYKLTDVFVVPWWNDDNLTEDLGHATALYINDLIKDHAFLGVGYGQTMEAFLRHFSSLTDKQVSVVSMTGGVSPYVRQMSTTGNDMKYYLIPAPLVMSSKRLANEILEEKPVADILALTEKTKVIVSSLGSMEESSTIVSSGVLTPEKYKNLRNKGAVGDMLMHFIDSTGNLVDDEIEDRIISTKLDKIKDSACKIVAAGGKDKYDIIQTALSTGLVDIMITDENTAKALIGDCLWQKEESTY